jgi:hypothetical protein
MPWLHMCFFFIGALSDTKSIGDGVGELAVHPNPQNDWPHNTTAKLS